MSERAPVVVVQLNGERHETSAGRTVAELIAELALTPQTALVEHNGQALFREEWSRVPLAEGDRLEILRVVAGG